LWQKGDRPEAALAYFHRVIDRHPDGRTVDDAEWAAARIYLRRQAWDRAIPLLDRLAARVDASWMVGTLNSPHASKARFELGWIHLLFLDDYAEAIDHFEQYLSDFPRNRRTDDSVWHLAHAHRLAGDMRAYRRALERLIEKYPESRYVERARQQLEMMQ
ncbi:MAG: tol-pal system YbgF family protein, partial [Bradymonadaceae bacterium]